MWKNLSQASKRCLGFKFLDNKIKYWNVEMWNCETIVVECKQASNMVILKYDNLWRRKNIARYKIKASGLTHSAVKQFLLLISARWPPMVWYCPDLHINPDYWPLLFLNIQTIIVQLVIIYDFHVHKVYIYLNSYIW